MRARKDGEPVCALISIRGNWSVLLFVSVENAHHGADRNRGDVDGRIVSEVIHADWRRRAQYNHYHAANRILYAGYGFVFLFPLRSCQ
ncbi:hypothetical protein M440DRAFT_1258394 [Trichoderma longibrachiatum ATCC 18648]|uniref:Uncharacterized protein n=1 Tax=Trichoderma longibrachiatum ATCC 18648 TaxID=983965 RepID=A0A2T4C2B2_TRILO|nr:hypothetical protein M440DRAFT_1258394 [Trichoderma longibrachiatum ATCC 18648]